MGRNNEIVFLSSHRLVHLTNTIHSQKRLLRLFFFRFLLFFFDQNGEFGRRISTDFIYAEALTDNKYMYFSKIDDRQNDEKGFVIFFL